MKLLNEIRNFAGMVMDVIRERIPKNKYYTAENINLTPNHRNEIGAATAMLGSTFAVDLGQINIASDGADYMAWRLPIDISSAGISHEFNFDNGTLVFSISTVGVTPALRLSNFIVALEAATVSILGDVYITPTPVSGVVYIGFKTQGAAHVLEEEINNIIVNTVVIKEFFGVAANGFFRPIKSIYINKNLYMLSTNSVVFRIGVAQKNYTTGSWTYTVLLETNQLTYSIDAIIDLDGEIDFGERVSLYFTGEGYTPRLFYIKEQTNWVANSGIEYYDSLTLSPDAYFNYNTIGGETSLQVLENFARVTDVIVNDTGGVLKSGNWQYYIRQKTDEATSGVGLGSGLVPIFTLPIVNPRLYGSEDGSITSKSVTITIDGLNPLRYEKFELIAVNNTAGVMTGVIAGEYNITSPEMTVVHNGLTDLADFSITELATQQTVVKSAKNLVIARNRLFLSNIQTENDPDLADAAKTILLSTAREYLSPVGNAYSTVNEYMNPVNVFEKTGYMWNETYRFGVVIVLKDGRVLPPYFVADYKIGSSGVTTFELADVPSGQVAIYAVNATIDLTLFPDINGIPFKDAVYGMSIVRQECINEVLSSGYLLIRTGVGSDNTYFTGGFLPYNQGFTSPGRQLGAFLSPDILFGNSSLSQIPSTYQVINYGQPSVYNNIINDDTSFTLTERRILKEFDGDIDTTPQIINTTGQGVLTQFNSINDNLSTRIDDPRGYGLNQRCIGMSFDNSNLPTKQTGNNELGFYYTQIFLAIASKYGPESRGLYQSTGHFLEITNPNIGYSTNVWGGDTFTQKTIIKAVNNRTFSGTYTISGGASPGTTLRVLIYANLSDGNLLSTPQIEIFLLNLSVVTLFWDNLSQFVSTTSSTVSNYTVWIFNVSLNTWFDGGTYSNTTTSTTLIVGSAVSPPPSAVGLNQAVGISFYSQNRGNYQLRTFNGDNINPDNLNYPYTTISLPEWFENPLNEGELNDSQSYSPLIPVTASSAAFDSESQIDTKETNVLIYSELKLTNGLYDNYRLFKPINRKEYPAKYGGINNTFLKDMNYLVILMDEIVLFQTLDQQQVQSNADGVAVTIGDGTVLGAREQSISNIGAPFKTMALNYKDNRGINHMTWFNPYLKKWMRWTGALDDIGEDTANQSFLTENTNFAFEERVIRFGHDFVNDELFITATSELDGSNEWDIGDTYNPGDIVFMFTNAVLDQRRYFQALIEVPVNKNPTIPINHVNYWKPYRQTNFTLAFNEKIKAMSDFKWFVPIMYMPFNETFLTHAINSETLESALYEHNTGIELYDTTDIDSSISIVFNDLDQYFKKFRIVLSDISLKPYFMIVRCGQYVSYAEDSDIKFHRPHWAANVMNDATISGANPTGSNKTLTAQPSDQTCEVTLYFRNDSITLRNSLREVIMKFQPLPPFFDK